MKLTKKLLGIIAIIAVIGFMALPLTGCQDAGDEGDNSTSGSAPAGTQTGGDTPITSVSISIAKPSKSGTPATTATTSGTVNFTMSDITWTPDEYDNGKFKGNMVYTAAVTLTAESGYKFTNSTTAKVNNSTATIKERTDETLTLEFAFPKTLAGVVSLIEIATQPTKKNYTQDEILNLNGLVVTVKFMNIPGETPVADSTVPKAFFDDFGITTIPADGAKLSVSENNGQPVVVSAGDIAVPANTDTLTVTARSLTIADFIVSGDNQTFTYDGTAKSVSVTADPDKTSGMGAITIKYDGNNTAPTNAKTSYAVTFDVAANANYNATSGLTAGTLTINKATPVVDDYDIGTNKLEQKVTAVSAIEAVPVTTKTSGLRSDGGVTVYYEGASGTTYTKSATKPLKVGTFTVTFEVTETQNWKATTTAFIAGTLEINVFKSVESLGTWLGSQAANNAATAYPVALNVSNLGGDYNTNGSAGKTLTGIGKYVNIDLSGSTFTSTGQTFRNCTLLTGITIPDSVTSIPNFDFYGCTNIPSIIIPNNVTSIGTQAFYGCTNLASVTLPTNANFTSIGQSAFSSCSSLTSITIPNSVTSINMWAFMNCTSLASVTFTATSKLTSIGQSAFSGCTSLGSITMPDSVTSIGGSAFNGCTNLASVTFAATSKLTSIEDSVFYGCASLASVTLPTNANFTSIGQNAFSSCSSLTSITIPNSVTSIGNNAFYICSNLNIMWYYNPAVTIPTSGFKEYVKTLIIPDSVITSIGTQAFWYYSNLTSVSIGNNVTSIGDYAFYSNSKLTSVTIGNNVTSIGDYAFASCPKLVSVTFATGSNIADASFGNNAFPEGGVFGNGNNNLKNTYLTENPKAGTYTRETESSTWTKQ